MLYAKGLLSNHSGTGQQWVAPVAGTYTMECWGANGGDATYSMQGSYITDGIAKGGIGGYTNGSITFSQLQSLFIYVGGAGQTISTKSTRLSGGFNGGGSTINENDAYKRCGSGGGATDVRLTSGNLNTRIMVAAGGGGACQSEGGAGGGLIGLYVNFGYVTYSVDSDGKGGKQNAATSNGPFGSYGTTTSSFGNGSQGLSIGGGGGGGWWGGAGGSRASKHDGAGGGGSSFISGHPGCNAVNSSGTHLGTSTTMTIGGKEYVFSSTVMIDGSGKQWTTASQTTGGATVGLPSKPETTQNGFCRITFSK